MHIKHKHIFSCDNDPAVLANIRANFKPQRVYSDITIRDAFKTPYVDIYVAGFPCQPFSLAGVSKKQSMNRPHGFNDPTQGTLFFDLKEIIKATRPKAFLLENVKNLRSHDGGNTYKTIIKTLEEECGSVSYTHLRAHET